MKKFYVLVLSIISIGPINGQITLTANNNPSVGDSFTSNGYDYSIFNEGSSGANVTWDFSNLTSVGTFGGTIVLPSTLSDNGNHPLANAAASDATAEAYYFLDSDEYSLVGVFSQGLSRDSYIDKREIYKFPITYGDSFNETFGGVHTNMLLAESFGRGGSIVIESDAYGTLIMPYGTINNVLRVKTTTSYADSISGFPFIIYEDIQYSWWNANTKGPILTNTTLTSSAGAPFVTGSYLSQADVITGLGDDFVQNSPILVYPNPATSQANISLNKPFNEASIKIIDVTGKIVKIEQLENGVQNVSFRLEELKRGIYFVQVSEENNLISTEKLIIK